MTNENPPSLILQAVDALQQHDRRRAAALIREDMRINTAPGHRWRSIGRLCDTIGEIDLAIEAARRYSAEEPQTLERILHYWGELAAYGRADRALEEVKRLPENLRTHPGILHFRGTIASQEGDFSEAEALHREALEKAPLAPQTWFALAMIKTFKPDDADLAEMARIRPQMEKAEPSVYARFLYALAKAHHDAGDYDRAFEAYSAGAAIRRAEEPYDPQKNRAFAERLVKEFTPEAAQKLTPSGCASERAIFINGLPRSGTTLVEQILTSHSAVSDGAELNLFRAALIPTGDFSFSGALSYQQRAQGAQDPWGELGRDYLAMLNARFGEQGRIVDKTLNHARFIGLLLHVLPKAKIIWLRRDPEDSALSCFRSFFTQPMPWCWSLEDIAAHFRMDDFLYRHWTTHFPERILTVPYEELASDPETWIPKILNHADLALEPQVFEPHKQKRTVRTASVAQVRNPISPNRIGAAKAYDSQMNAFRKVYYAD